MKISDILHVSSDRYVKVHTYDEHNHHICLEVLNEREAVEKYANIEIKRAYKSPFNHWITVIVI